MHHSTESLDGIGSYLSTPGRQYILLHVTSENHELSKDVLSEDWPRDYTANGVFYMQLACHKIRARRH